MNSSLFSFIFLINLVIIFIIVLMFIDHFTKNQLTNKEHLKLFYYNLNLLPEIELLKYFQINSLMNSKGIFKKTLSNKQLFYYKEKLVLKISLRTNKIIYKFKNKYLLK
jgi:hypothetical protein